MDRISHWISGHLTPGERIFGALIPVIVLGLYFLVAFVLYVLRFGRKGFRDQDLAKRAGLAASPIAHYFLWSINPLWEVIRKSGIPANAVTSLSLLIATAAGVSMAAGRFALGGWLFILSGVCDLIDGRLARLRGEAGPRGAAFDSILDRYSDAIVMGGLAWYYRNTWVLVAVLAAMAGAQLISYARAKGEALQAEMRLVGRFQRPERVLILGVTVAFSPIPASLLYPQDPHPMHWLAVAGILVLAVGTQLTAAHRTLHLLKVLTPPEARPPKPKRTVSKAVVSSVLATGVDFSAVTVLVELARISPALATGVGCLVGALVNYTLNRLWTFQSRSPKVAQMGRYGFVSVSSALLNAGGVGVLGLLPGMDYRLAWAITRAFVFLAWNFPLHRDYVFPRVAPSREPTDHPA